MAIKKSQLYSSLWQSRDELRGGMDASQYKDYVLTLLFMKYVSDKYAGKSDALIEIPEGGGFAEMVKLKGEKQIGEPVSCLEYLLAHEIVHFIERRHTERFRQLMDAFMPGWRLSREEPNRAPLAHEEWRY
jgi:type I restriction-modification system DNA methylase subunit